MKQYGRRSPGVNALHAYAVAQGSRVGSTKAIQPECLQLLVAVLRVDPAENEIGELENATYHGRPHNCRSRSCAVARKPIHSDARTNQIDPEWRGSDRFGCVARKSLWAV